MARISSIASSSFSRQLSDPDPKTRRDCNSLILFMRSWRCALIVSLIAKSSSLEKTTNIVGAPLSQGAFYPIAEWSAESDSNRRGTLQFIGLKARPNRPSLGIRRFLTKSQGASAPQVPVSVSLPLYKLEVLYFRFRREAEILASVGFRRKSLIDKE